MSSSEGLRWGIRWQWVRLRSQCPWEDFHVLCSPLETSGCSVQRKQAAGVRPLAPLQGRYNHDEPWNQSYTRKG